MNSIDQKILIPSPQQVIWDYISTIENNPDWQVDCLSVAFLTSFHKGQGARWRSMTEGGREVVVEIVTWYDRLGYEYRFIDGSPYKQNNGRLRLQEVAEGTMLQWTFNYEAGGVLGGLRNSLGLKRTIENSMQDSLWTLWRHLSQSSAKGDFEIKSLMRDAPDVESRAQYKSRHPSVMEDYTAGQPLPSAITEPVVPSSPIFIPEPPIAEDDTRPRLTITDSQMALPPVPEPDFLQDVRSTSEIDLDAPTNPNVFASQESIAPNQQPVIIDPVMLPEQPAFDDAPIEMPPFQSQPEPEMVDSSTVTTIEDDKRDTSQMSIFEIFGVNKPSESQEVSIVNSAEMIENEMAVPTPSIEPTVVFTDAPLMLQGSRRGKRLLARSALVKVRRPG